MAWRHHAGFAFRGDGMAANPMPSSLLARSGRLASTISPLIHPRWLLRSDRGPTRIKTFYNRCNYFSSSSTTTTTIRAHSSASSPFLLTRWYTNLLDSHPILTKMVSSGLIAASGDALCQSWLPTSTDEANDDDEPEERGAPDKAPQILAAAEDHEEGSMRSWDWSRTGRFGILGTFLVAPTVHVWYNHLHRWTSNLSIASSPWRLLMSRVAIDQMLFAPAFTAVWLVALRFLEGQRPIEWDSLKASVPEVVVANWALWVPAQFVNFAMVPLKFQVLYSNVVALVWNVYLSYTTSRNHPSASRELATSSSSRSSEP